MFHLQDTLWAGTRAALLDALSAETLCAANLSAPAKSDETPALLRVVGNVGVVSIRGSMIKRDLPEEWITLFGVTTYPAIRRAMLAALQDEKVTQILLDIDSGGGMVAGVAETADLIGRIHRDHKPVSAHGSNVIASAAIWLGVSGGHLQIDRGTIAGSIGVISTHVEYSKALAEDGVTATVFRAGKFKALGQPVEPLTEAAREQIQARLDNTYTAFIEHVAQQRGVTATAADQRMGQGREFFGAGAVTAGLVDAVASFDDLLSSLQERPVSQVRFSKRNVMSTSATLTEAQLAAAETEAQAALDNAAEAEAQAAASEGEQAETEQPAEAAVETDTEAAAGDTEQTAQTEDQSGVIAFLRGELAQLHRAQAQAALELEQARAALAAHEVMLPAFADMARTSLNRMRVALDLGEVTLTGMTNEALLAEHKRVSEEFSKKFKVGGVAAVALPERQDGAAVRKASNAHAAAIRATRHK